MKLLSFVAGVGCLWLFWYLAHQGVVYFHPLGINWHSVDSPLLFWGTMAGLVGAGIFFIAQALFDTEGKGR